MNATTDNREWASSGSANRSTSDLQREGEEIRADLDRTLDQIERKLSPGELLDRSMQFVRENGSEFLTEAGETVRRNPVPVLLTAAGLLWLTSSIVSSRSDGSGRSAQGGSRSRFGGRQGQDSAEDDSGSEYSSGEFSGDDSAAGADSFGQNTDQNTDQNTQGAQGGARQRVRSAARKVKGKLSTSMHAVQEQTGVARSNLTNLIQQQPVALGALALAAGALLGAALPMTRYENRLFGPVHDRTMARVKEVGEQQYENVRQAVASSMDRSSGGGNGSNGNGANRGDQGSQPATAQG